MRMFSFLILLICTSVFAGIEDREGDLSRNDFNRLNRITESIQRNSGEKLIVILLADKERGVLSRLITSFAAELNVQGEKQWVLALISPSGKVKLCASKELEGFFTEIHFSSFSSGAERILESGRSSEAVEFLLLNVADVIAQKKKIDLGDILDMEKSASGDIYIFDLKDIVIAVVLVALLLMLLLGRALKPQKTVSRSLEDSSPLFGCSFHEGDQIMFGTSFKNGVDHDQT